MTASWAKWKVNLLLLGLSALLCLIGAEIAVRFIRPDLLRSQSLPNIMVPDDTLGWRGEANSIKTHRVGRTIVEIKTNEQGFRDDPYPSFESVKNKRRILFLGDSFCWGFGVHKAERISEAVESLDSTCEAYNFGIFGYSTDQELLSLKMFGSKVKPNEVALLFCLNDLVYNNSKLGHRMPKPLYHLNGAGKLVLGNVPVPKTLRPNPFKTWLKKHSALYNALDRAIALVQGKFSLKKTIRGNSQTRVAPDQATADGEITPYLLAEMRDECQRQGANLTVIVVPSSQEWTEKQEVSPKEAQQVDEWCRQAGIPVLDLFPDFHQQYMKTRQNLYVADFEDQMHWNGNGHHLAAEILLNYLQHRGTDKSNMVNP